MRRYSALGSALSIRARVAVVSTIVVAIALSVTAAIIVLVQREILTDRIDDAILERADDIASLAAAGSLPERLATNRRAESFIQVVDSSGAVVAASANVEGAAPVLPVEQWPSERVITESRRSPVEDDESFHIVAQPASSPGGQLVVFVGGSLEPVAESTESLIIALAIALPALTVTVGGASWFLTGRALAPVEAIRSEVSEIGGASLERRVPVPRTHDEVARLAGTMNDMLDRIEEAHARQRRFVADASHELRSPLAGIRAALEVAQSDAREVPSESVLADVVRLESLIADLLIDAEIEDGGERTPEAVDLDDMVFEEAAALRQRGVSIDTSEVSAAQVSGERSHLRRAIRNLLDNAARHAGTGVTVELAEQAGTARLAVSDDGPGVPEAHRESIFERFARGDGARDRESGGAGLGLAITRAIAERHGGRVYVDPGHESGARFVLELPLNASKCDRLTGERASSRSTAPELVGGEGGIRTHTPEGTGS